MGFGYLALPPVIGDLQEFGREMPTRLPALLDRLQHIPILQRFVGGNIGAEVQSVISNTATGSSAFNQELGQRTLQHCNGRHPDRLFHP